MHWYVKQFADGQVRLRPGGGAEEFFEVFDAFASTRPDALLCAEHAAGHGLLIYLSPAAEEFARMVQATVCAQPAATGLHLLRGRDAAWRSWFGAAPG